MMPAHRRYRPPRPTDPALSTTVGNRPSRTKVVQRPRRSKAEVESLRDTLFRLLQGDHPQSVRHVFYLMTDPRLLDCAVEKSERAIGTSGTILLRCGRPASSPTDGSLTRRGAATSSPPTRAA
jgi:hypothetical protein